MSTKNSNYRIRVTNNGGGKGYVVRKGDKVSFYNTEETPLSFNYITNNAAELRFELEDAANAAAAAQALRKAAYVKTVEII